MMNKIVFAVVLLTVLFLTGCTISDAEVGSKASTPISKPAPVKETRSAVSSFSISNAIETRMRVKFLYGENELEFCRKLARRISGMGILQNAEVVTEGTYDASISIIPEFEVKDKAGDYYRVICNEVAVTVVCHGKLFGSKVVEPVAQPRKLGLDNAKNQYLKAVAGDVAAFIGSTLSNMSSSQLGISEITFKLANTGKNDIAGQIAKEVERLHLILKKNGGVVNYQNIFQDSVKGICTFRIVYIKNKFPQGIVNALNLELSKKN